MRSARSTTEGRNRKATRERKRSLVGILVVTMFSGCSYEPNIETAAPSRMPQTAHAGVIDHLVPHISTAHANEGSRVSLFMRQRRGDSLGPAVLLVHGRAAAAIPSFDLDYQDYSWMRHLADAAFDVFAVDLQGYGNSSKPEVMDEPCNTSHENQTKYLVPNPLRAPCPPSYPYPFGSFATDWDEIDTVVEFIRSLRGDRTLKVNLVGWSRGGMRVIGYAALRPYNVEKVVALNPTRFPPDPTVRDYPINMTDERDFFAAWDQQIDSRNCPDQVDPSIRRVLWNSTIALDTLGSRWGAGVRRSPSFTAAGWTPDLPGRVQAPTLVIRGALDSQAPEPATRALYDALGGPKAYLTVSCGSHELVYEKQHTTLLHASDEWLRFGTQEGRLPGSTRKPPVVTATDAPAGTETLPMKWIRVAVPNLGVMQAAVARPKGTGPFPQSSFCTARTGSRGSTWNGPTTWRAVASSPWPRAGFQAAAAPVRMRSRHRSLAQRFRPWALASTRQQFDSSMPWRRRRGRCEASARIGSLWSGTPAAAEPSCNTSWQGVTFRPRCFIPRATPYDQTRVPESSTCPFSSCMARLNPPVAEAQTTTSRWRVTSKRRCDVTRKQSRRVTTKEEATTASSSTLLSATMSSEAVPGHAWLTPSPPGFLAAA
jgi:pimeloyl-ACP methyl ester carboxylesterase